MKLSNTDNTAKDHNLVATLENLKPKYELFKHYEEIHYMIHEFCEAYEVLSQIASGKSELKTTKDSTEIMLIVAEQIEEFIEEIKQ